MEKSTHEQMNHPRASSGSQTHLHNTHQESHNRSRRDTSIQQNNHQQNQYHRSRNNQENKVQDGLYFYSQNYIENSVMPNTGNNGQSSQEQFLN